MMAAEDRLDPLLADSRAAAVFFAIGTGLLLLGAALGLNTWPAQQIGGSLAGGAKDIFLALHGYAIMLAALFWASRPPLRHQQIALVAWLGCGVVISRALGDELPIGWTDPRLFPPVMFLATTLALPCTLLLFWRVVRPAAPGTDALFEARLRWLVGMAVLFMLVPQPALSLTGTLHPQTLDMFALHWDRAAGLNIAPGLIRWIDSIPAAPEIVGMAYGLTPLGFASCALLHLRGRPAHVSSALITWVGITIGALLAYHFFPVTGPQYVFGSREFPTALLSSSAQPIDFIGLPGYPRNGMPSMHFGWMLAASIMWWRSGTGALSRAILIAMTVATAIATIYTGEHYVVDLIVAVPFVLAMMALCSTGVRWAALERRGTVALGLATWLAWVMLLRWQIVWLVEHPWSCHLMVAATAGVVAVQARWMARFPQCLSNSMPVLAMPAGWRSPALRLGFFSAAAVSGLLTLLSVQMGTERAGTMVVYLLAGLAVGAIAGVPLARQVRVPWAALAVFDVATAVLGLAALSALAGLSSGGSSFALLLVAIPAGARLPLASTRLPGPDHPAGVATALAAGAATGLWLSIFVFGPLLGGTRAGLVWALLALLCALAAIENAKKDAEPVQTAALPGLMPWRITPALAGCGVLAAVLQQGYGGLLAMTVGNSVYASASSNFAWLAGLALGAGMSRRIPFAQLRAPAMVAILMLLLLVAIPGWQALPDYLASLSETPAAYRFASREAIRGLVCALMLLPPSVVLGALTARLLAPARSGTCWTWLACGGLAGVILSGLCSGVLSDSVPRQLGVTAAATLGQFKSAQAAAAADEADAATRQRWSAAARSGSGRSRLLADGADRSALKASAQPLDLIEIPCRPLAAPETAGSYSQDFYRLARRHLAAAGRLQQCLPLSELQPLDTLQIVATLRSEFERVWLYSAGSAAVLVAGDAKATPLEAASGELLLDPAAIDRYLAQVAVDPRIWVATDANQRLAFALPRTVFIDGAAAAQAQRQFMERFRSP